MELTKVCVELIWRLCFGVEFVWIFNIGFIPTFGIDCRKVLCRVFGMFCGLNWEDIVADGQGPFRDGFGSKLACIGASKELSSTQLCGSHAIVWLGLKLYPLSTQLR